MPLSRRRFLRTSMAAAAAAALPFDVLAQGAKKQKCNVLLLICDDLNDYVSGFGGHPQAKTPAIEKFARTGTLFTHAYCNATTCVPSRNSMITGLYPHHATSAWVKWYEHPVYKNSKTFMAHLRDNDYHSIGTGKIDHQSRPDQYTKWYNPARYGPFWYENGKRGTHPGTPAPFNSIGPVDGSFGAIEDAPVVEGDDTGWHTETGWKNPPRRMRKDPVLGWMTPDKINAHLMADILAGRKDGLVEPFFMGVGFVRPHTPLHVEKRFFEQHPLSKLKTEPRKPGDADDTFWKDFNDRKKDKGYRYFDLLRESYHGTDEGLSAFSQAYLASVSAVDQNVDTVLTALDNSPYRDNTIVVLTSDHGWQMGEKQWLFKGSPWEESCRVPMIIRVPGMTRPGSRCDQPVSLIDLYPTLVDLCGLTGSTVLNDNGRPLDGHSMRPLLEDPDNGEWDGPDIAVTTFHVQPPKNSGREWRAQDNHYSVRSRRYRYIRYNDGREELYDHDHDPYEWNNVATDPAMAEVKRSLLNQLSAETGVAFGAAHP